MGTAPTRCRREHCHNEMSKRKRRGRASGKRIIVDEGVGENSSLWRLFAANRRLSEEEVVFLRRTHRGIPDVEILDKLLSPQTILVTTDRVLHNRARAAGFPSFTLVRGRLTGKRIPGIRRLPKAAPSVLEELESDYVQPPNRLATSLKAGMSEKAFKRARTRRRRIRSYFGAVENISKVSLSLGARPTPSGLLSGYHMNIAANRGLRGLSASEGYCLPRCVDSDPALPIFHAVREVFVLQLDFVPIELFVMPPAGLQLCRSLLGDKADATRPMHQALQELLRGLPRLTLSPCVKGRFYDAMERKLHQLEISDSNEITTVDFDAICAAVLSQRVTGSGAREVPDGNSPGL